MSQDDNKTSKKNTKAKKREDAVQLGDDQPGPAVNKENERRSKERPQARSEHVHVPHKVLEKTEAEASPVSPGATVTLQNVKIEVPTVDADAMNLPSLGHVDFRLGRKASAGLRKLLGGCLVSGKKIHNGHVNSSAMALRWVLELIADSE